jgi:hypothetical protein
MSEMTQELNTSRTLQEIRELSAAMLETPEDERVLLYKRLNRQFLELEGGLIRRSQDSAIVLLDKLKVHLIALARLDDPDQLSDDQHMSAAMQTLDQLGRMLGSR